MLCCSKSLSPYFTILLLILCVCPESLKEQRQQLNKVNEKLTPGNGGQNTVSNEENGTQETQEAIISGQNAYPDASSRSNPADSSCPNSRRREGRREQRVRLHQERVQGRGRHVEVQKRGKAALHSHVGLSR